MRAVRTDVRCDAHGLLGCGRGCGAGWASVVPAGAVLVAALGARCRGRSWRGGLAAATRGDAGGGQRLHESGRGDGGTGGSTTRSGSLRGQPDGRCCRGGRLGRAQPLGLRRQAKRRTGHRNWAASPRDLACMAAADVRRADERVERAGPSTVRSVSRPAREPGRSLIRSWGCRGAISSRAATFHGAFVSSDSDQGSGPSAFGLDRLQGHDQMEGPITRITFLRSTPCGAGRGCCGWRPGRRVRRRRRPRTRARARPGGSGPCRRGLTR
jgi:hypothetical protein